MARYKQEHNSIKMWAEDDRPREKFIFKGRSSLSDAELIAIQLGSGSRDLSALDLAKRILSSVDNSITRLASLSVEELTRFRGVGEAKAINILSALEIGRRREEDVRLIRTFNQSKHIFDEFKGLLSDLGHEEFWCLFLNTANKKIKKERISGGGINSTLVDERLILKRALLLSATAIILVHNHPSGSLNPSQSDIQVTRKIKDAAKLMSITVLDHIIIGNKEYYSFADEGKI